MHIRRDAQNVPRIIALQGAATAAIQALLGDFAAELKAQGLRVAGLVEGSQGDARGACGSLVLRDLASDALFPMSQDLGPGSKACNLDPEGLARACAALERSIAAGADLVVISKFGKQEAARSGLSAAFQAAALAGLPIMTSVSPSLTEAWQSFAGPSAEILAAERHLLRAWWRDVSGRRAA